jgi:hypothetical protein
MGPDSIPVSMPLVMSNGEISSWDPPASSNQLGVPTQQPGGGDRHTAISTSGVVAMTMAQTTAGPTTTTQQAAALWRHTQTEVALTNQVHA